MRGPCRDCADRYLGCHADCQRYQAFDQANQARRQEQSYQRTYVSDREFGARIKSQESARAEKRRKGIT